MTFLIIILILIVLIVALRVLTTYKFAKAEKYADFTQVMKEVDAPMDELFDKGDKLLNNSDFGIMNKKIQDKILNITLNKKVVNPKSELNTMNNEAATETNDLIRMIFDMDNQIFTDSVNHDLLCKNLKYELIKLMEDNKPVSMLVRDFNITSKKNN